VHFQPKKNWPWHWTQRRSKTAARAVIIYVDRFLGQFYMKKVHFQSKKLNLTFKTHTQTDCPKPLFSTFWGLYIPNPVLSRSRFFARCQYFHWHGSNIGQSTTCAKRFLWVRRYDKSSPFYSLLSWGTEWKVPFSTNSRPALRCNLCTPITLFN